MKIVLLFLVVIAIGGAVAWGLRVLPPQLQQAELGAGVGEGLSEVLPQKTAVVEPPKENAIPVVIAPPQVKPGGKVQVTVGAPQPDSVRSIEIFLESPNGLQTSQGNIWNINGEGQWFDHVPIPQDAELGIWKIKTIEITDTTGNITSYSWGKEIFSTFTVE